MACCNNPTTPSLIICMYVGSDVSLAEYLCTHVAIIYIFTEDAATPSDGFYVDVDINEQAKDPGGDPELVMDHVVQLGFQASFILLVVCTQTSYFRCWLV